MKSGPAFKSSAGGFAFQNAANRHSGQETIFSPNPYGRPKSSMIRYGCGPEQFNQSREGLMSSEN